MKGKILNMMVFFSVFLWVSGIGFSADAMEVHPLDFRVLDAEYSKTLDTIIVVSTTPTNAVHVYDPRSKTDISIDLPLTPTCVSVSLDGLYAAIGHDGWISYVNLTTFSVEKVISVSCDVLDIVLAGNGYVYAFPRRDQWERIRCININTEMESLHSGNYIYAGTLAKLHPNGKAIYGADNGLSPSDIEKYSIENGTAQYLYDSPYHGNYAMCGDLWISEDGFRIFTRCGNVFRSSDIREEDMVYNGSLSELDRIENLSHSLESNKVVVIPESSQFTEDNEDTEIQIYDYDFLAFENRTELPAFRVGSSTYPAHGRFVYHNDDGSEFYVIVQADNTAGLIYDYGIVTFGTEQNDSPIADAGGDKVVFDEVALDGGNSVDPDGTIESYEWVLKHTEDSQYDRTAEGVNPVVSNLAPGFYNVTLTVTDNEGLTGTDTMLVAAAGPCASWPPPPNVDLNLKHFSINSNKRSGRAITSMTAESTNLPELTLDNNDTVESRITIELFGAIDGGDLILSDVMKLKIRDLKNILIIQK